MNTTLIAEDVGFYSDATAAENLGYGIVFKNNWMFGQWEHNFVKKYDPSIEFLELFALVGGIITYAEQLARTRLLVH